MNGYDYIKWFMSGQKLESERQCEVRQIEFFDGERHIIYVYQEPEEKNRPTRYEVVIEKGISTGESDQHGNSLTFSWVLPCNSVDEAVEKFVDRIEEIREAHDYYELSNQYL